MTKRPSLLTAFALVVPAIAQAQFTDLVCDDTMRLREQLRTIVGATPQAHGLRDPETMIEVWIVPSSGDWTIVQKYANGTSCVLAIGEYWEAIQTGPA